MNRVVKGLVSLLCKRCPAARVRKHQAAERRSYKNWAKSLVCLALAVLLPSYGFADPLTVPFGTTVLCELDQEVVSKENEFSEGDIVRAHVLQDVRVGGRVIVKAGTPVHTRISRLQKARIAGRKGQLELEALNEAAESTGATSRLRVGTTSRGRARSASRSLSRPSSLGRSSL